MFVNVALGLCLAILATAAPDESNLRTLRNVQESIDLKVVIDLIKRQEQRIESTVSELKEIVERQREEIGQLRQSVEGFKLKQRRDNKETIYRTCEEIQAADPQSASGDYWIDPDGVGTGDAPIYVYCDMNSGSTLISHDSEAVIQVVPCLDPGCYNRTIVYNATVRQMAALAELSRSCRQSFRFDCLSVPFEFNGVQQAWWTDRNGNPQFYWAGSSNTAHTCQCGIDGNCALPELKCNCDSLAVTELSDSGHITNMSALPVTKLNFGRTLLNTTYGRHALGKFECSGRTPMDGRPKSCQDLRMLGHSLSGYYDVQGTDELRSVYCDFSFAPGEQDFETAVGSVDIKSSPVYFHVQRTSDFSASGKPIAYQIELLNVGRGMNLTSGIFTAPRGGLYQFHFTGLKGPSATLIAVYLYRNNDRVTTTFSPDINNYLHLSLSAILKLSVNDQVHLLFEGPGILHENPARFYTNFIGLLIQEDLKVL